MIVHLTPHIQIPHVISLFMSPCSAIPESDNCGLGARASSSGYPRSSFHSLIENDLLDQHKMAVFVSDHSTVYLSLRLRSYCIVFQALGLRSVYIRWRISFLRKLPRATTNVQKNKSYVGLFISYVGLFISYVGLIKSYVGLYNSYVGDKIS